MGSAVDGYFLSLHLNNDAGMPYGQFGCRFRPKGIPEAAGRTLIRRMNLVDTIKRRPRAGCPEPVQIIELRRRSNRTQVQLAEELCVSARQVTRWEVGEQEMPGASWNYMKLKYGYRFPDDFETVPNGMSRTWDSNRDQERDTIERGDVVELQAVSGPLLRAVVWLDRVHDGLIDENGYGATIASFVEANDAGQQYKGFFITERIWFSRQNVIHIEQAVPRQSNKKSTSK